MVTYYCKAKIMAPLKIARTISTWVCQPVTCTWITASSIWATPSAGMKPSDWSYLSSCTMNFSPWSFRIITNVLFNLVIHPIGYKKKNVNQGKIQIKLVIQVGEEMTVCAMRVWTRLVRAPKSPTKITFNSPSSKHSVPPPRNMAHVRSTWRSF